MSCRASPKKQKQSSSWRDYIPFLGKNKQKEETGGHRKTTGTLCGGQGDFNKKKPLILTEETSISLSSLPAATPFRATT